MSRFAGQLTLEAVAHICATGRRATARAVVSTLAGSLGDQLDRELKAISKLDSDAAKPLQRSVLALVYSVSGFSLSGQDLLQTFDNDLNTALDALVAVLQWPAASTALRVAAVHTLARLAHPDTLFVHDDEEATAGDSPATTDIERLTSLFTDYVRRLAAAMLSPERKVLQRILTIVVPWLRHTSVVTERCAPLDLETAHPKPDQPPLRSFAVDSAFEDPLHSVMVGVSDLIRSLHAYAGPLFRASGAAHTSALTFAVDATLPYALRCIDRLALLHSAPMPADDSHVSTAAAASSGAGSGADCEPEEEGEDGDGDEAMSRAATIAGTLAALGLLTVATFHGRGIRAAVRESDLLVRVVECDEVASPERPHALRTLALVVKIASNTDALGHHRSGMGRSEPLVAAMQRRAQRSRRPRRPRRQGHRGGRHGRARRGPPKAAEDPDEAADSADSHSDLDSDSDGELPTDAPVDDAEKAAVPLSSSQERLLAGMRRRILSLNPDQWEALATLIRAPSLRSPVFQGTPTFRRLAFAHDGMQRRIEVAGLASDGLAVTPSSSSPTDAPADLSFVEPPDSEPELVHPSPAKVDEIDVRATEESRPFAPTLAPSAEVRSSPVGLLPIARRPHHLAPMSSSSNVLREAASPPLGALLRPPRIIVCPMSRQVMSDPVETPDGFVCDRPSLIEWFAANGSADVDDAELSGPDPLSHRMIRLGECRARTDLADQAAAWTMRAERLR